ncbi:hypothetical protein [uncultured Winogradskyella sp.]|uniref:hypothetical protein n=1 Tax=uncultured Winogradskyella sp. TaxID=395353 RepID=UPI00260B0D31|nr:hypothetical protein [uncultured Winogradskyella sp.]
MNEIIKRLLKKWVIKNFKEEIRSETKIINKVKHVKTILVKKGKIREWRSYDENHNRIDLIK